VSDIRVKVTGYLTLVDRHWLLPLQKEDGSLTFFAGAVINLHEVEELEDLTIEVLT
jgi:hypothetical protein